MHHRQQLLDGVGGVVAQGGGPQAGETSLGTPVTTGETGKAGVDRGGYLSERPVKMSGKLNGKIPPINRKTSNPHIGALQS